MSGSEQIDGFVRDIVSVRDELSSRIENLSYEQLNWRPNEKRWSAGHVAAHLCKVAQEYSLAINASAAEARKEGHTGDGTAAIGLIWKFVLWIMRPPVRLKMPAPKIFLPLPNQRRKELLKEITKSHDDLIKSLTSAKGLDLKRVRIVSPVSTSFVLTLPRCATFLIAHSERHLWQIDRLIVENTFPAGRKQ
ncbi:MAG: DinB family protein [Bdellovibrionales bacterium]|nr:DinB family protein [Bdellovibrionales bacterium]